ncbi:MAG TPA: hypothetical protein VER03_15080 [Bryobacteraceae bacterium]|nr:hypothetical protein [Bryobacteraceae bacterium]
MTGINYKRSLNSVGTEGLSSSGLQEIRVKVSTTDLFQEAEEFLRFVANYVTESGRQIHSEETLVYGYWLVKLRAGDGALEVWEYDAEATDFVPGADLALTYWRDQHRVCNQAGAPFRPPRPDRLTVVDEWVMEGLPVQAVRYPSPEHMSGWWITTDRYNGDVNSVWRQLLFPVGDNYFSRSTTITCLA